MAKWLVTIDSEGAQTQFGLGSGDIDKNAQDEKRFSKESLVSKAKVLFVFDNGRLPVDNHRDREELSKIQSKLRNSFYQKRGAFNPSEYFGYQMRQNTLGKYIEVISELEADDVGEFH